MPPKNSSSNSTRDKWLVRVRKLSAKKPLPKWVETAPKWVHDDTEIMSIVAEKEGLSLGLASEQLQNDRELVTAAVTCRGRALESASRTLQDDRSVVLAAVKSDGNSLRYASLRIQDDHEIAMAAVKQNVYAIYFVSNRLKVNKYFALEVIQIVGYKGIRARGGNGARLCDRLADDKSFILEAVGYDGFTLYGASPRLKADEEVVLAAVEDGGRYLCYASERLKSKTDIVLKAMQKNTQNTQYGVWHTLGGEYNVILTAVMKNPSALGSASDRLKDHEMLMLTALANPLATERNGLCIPLKSISERLRDDSVTMLAVFEAFGHFHQETGKSIPVNTCQYISPRLFDSKEFMLQAAALCGHEALYLAQSERISRDPHILAVAKAFAASVTVQIEDEGRAKKRAKMVTGLRFMDCQRRCDKDTVLDWVKTDGLALRYAGDDLRKHDEDVVTQAIQQNGEAILYAGKQFQFDAKLVALSIESCPLHRVVVILKSLPQHLRRDKEVIQATKAKGWVYGLLGDCDDRNLILCGLKRGDDCFGFSTERLRRDKKLIVAAIRQSSQNIEHVPTDMLMETGFLTELAATTQFEQHVKRLPKFMFGGDRMDSEKTRLHAIINNSSLSLTTLVHALCQNPQIILN